jgi:aspartate-semialdehyde dehydrogenase
MPRFAILDPLTLVGQALTIELKQKFPSADVSLFHTTGDEEHQISEIGGEARLVPPLGDGEVLSEYDVVLLAADRISPHLKPLEQTLEDDDTIVFIDASSLNHYRYLTTPALNSEAMTPGARLRPAHSSVAVADRVLRALAEFEPTELTISAIEPVSIYGKEAISTLAHQAAQRLQGDEVSEKIDKRVAAFNLTAVSGTDLVTEATLLFPHLEISATRTLAGWFHGHLAILNLTFASPLPLKAAVRALKNAPDLILKKTPLHIDGVSDREGICFTPPETSSGGHILSLQTMVDGLQIGGAVTVAAMLEGFGEG